MKKPVTRKRSKDDDGAPNPTDIHVGSRLRMRRMLLGMSQEKLGLAVGLTFQQVQKYERGTNRIGASRLFDLGKALNVPVGYFFEEMVPSGGAGFSGLAEDQAGFEGSSMVKREGLELLRAYNSIRDPEVRRQVLHLVKSIVKSVQADEEKPAALTKRG